jgi:hypothetical protein
LSRHDRIAAVARCVSQLRVSMSSESRSFPSSLRVGTVSAARLMSARGHARCEGEFGYASARGGWRRPCRSIWQHGCSTRRDPMSDRALRWALADLNGAGGAYAMSRAVAAGVAAGDRRRSRNRGFRDAVQPTADRRHPLADHVRCLAADPCLPLKQPRSIHSELANPPHAS